MQRSITFAVLIALLCATVIAAQQTSTPESDDFVEEISCEAADIADTQMELNATLDRLEADLEKDTDTALAQLYDVGLRYQEIALYCGYIPPNAGELMVGTKIDQILEVLATLHGDPITGQLLYNSADIAADGGQLGCSGCHSAGDIAPATEGTWTRWDEIYSELEQFKDYDFEHYIVESIVHPEAYAAPGYVAGMMPQNFGDRLDFQNLADIVAYLETQDQLIED